MDDGETGEGREVEEEEEEAEEEEAGFSSISSGNSMEDSKEAMSSSVVGLVSCPGLPRGDTEEKVEGSGEVGGLFVRRDTGTGNGVSFVEGKEEGTELEAAVNGEEGDEGAREEDGQVGGGSVRPRR